MSDTIRALIEYSRRHCFTPKQMKADPTPDFLICDALEEAGDPLGEEYRDSLRAYFGEAALPVETRYMTLVWQAIYLKYGCDACKAGSDELVESPR